MYLLTPLSNISARVQRNEANVRNEEQSDPRTIATKPAIMLRKAKIERY